MALMRAYNLREGLTSADDVLPDRSFTLPVDAGRLTGAVLDRPTFADARRLRHLLGWPAPKR
jgi:aldehyde:ferredoxin oxidoreductase